jgi:hypothetical protein
MNNTSTNAPANNANKNKGGIMNALTGLFSAKKNTNAPAVTNTAVLTGGKRRKSRKSKKSRKTRKGRKGSRKH